MKPLYKKHYCLLTILAVLIFTEFKAFAIAEYAISWNAGTCELVVAASSEDETASDVATAVSSYITTSGISWLSLYSVDTGNTSEEWSLCFVVSDNESAVNRYADFTPWDFRIIQVGSQSTGPAVTSPAGGLATVFPGETVTLSVTNLTGSVRTALKRRPLTGGTYTVVDSLSLVAPSCSFTLQLPDGQYSLAQAGLDFTVRYSEPYYYAYNVSAPQTFPATIPADGGTVTVYISSYTDGNNVTHTVNSISDLSILSPVIGWINGGAASGWDAAIDAECGYDSSHGGYLRFSCPPNISTDSRSWDTLLRRVGGGTITVSQDGGGSLSAASAAVSGNVVSVFPAQYGVRYEVNDGVTSVSTVSSISGDILTLNISGSGMGDAFTVYSEYGGLRRSLLRYVTENNIPATEGPTESAGFNNIRKSIHYTDFVSSSDLIYYDGLGRPKQEVFASASSNLAYDVVRPVRMDFRGREWRVSLPYAAGGTTGSYRPGAFAAQASWWYSEGYCNEGDEYAYSTSVLESAGSGRTLSSFLPGDGWHDNANGSHYTYGRASGIYRLEVSANTGNLLVAGTYDSADVLADSVTDGDGVTRTVFRDLEGRLVAEGCAAEGVYTYYAYDACGRLRWVVSPEGAKLLYSGGEWGPDSAFAGKWCYVYTYDARGRLVVKRCPGASPQYTVYDQGGRQVLFQDGNMRSTTGGAVWKAAYYDGCGRVVREDLRSGGQYTREEIQSGFDTNGTHPVYAVQSSGTAVREYSWDACPAQLPQTLAFQPDSLVSAHSGTKGHLAYERLGILGTSQYAQRTMYYDSEDRVAQQVTLYPDGTRLRTSFAYDLQGNVLRSRSTCSDSGAHYGIQALLDESYSYDARGRLTERRSLLVSDGDSCRSRTSFGYDALGRCNRTEYGDSANVAAVLLKEFTMQGFESSRRLMRGDSVLFASRLLYESPLSDYGYTEGDNDVSWNGNVSGWIWSHSGSSPKAWALGYDALGRLSSAEQHIPGGREGLWEESVTFDSNSNVLSMVRNNGSATPELRSYQYDGNHRSKYAYDANGNVTCTHSRIVWYDEEEWDDISSTVKYNILNLPCRVNRDGGEDAEFLYLADGTKWKALFYEDGGIIYVGPFRYRMYAGTRFLEDVGAAGGRIRCYGNLADLLDSDPEPDPSLFVASPRPQYLVCDHTGSVRVLLSSNGSVSGRCDYLPFGEKARSNGLTMTENDYLWCGKELHGTQFFDTPFYDSGARYVATDGSFVSPDPEAESYPGISPYAYCAGNPVRYVDPTGKRPIYSRYGVLLGVDENGLQDKPIIMEEKFFVPNMDPKLAEGYDLGREGLIDADSRARFEESLNSLCNRPDWDGHLTLHEANEWYRHGHGQPLFVSLENLDMSRMIYLGLLKEGEKRTVRLLWDSFSPNDFLVFGNFTVEMKSNHTIKAFADTYNFEMHPWWNPLNWARNIETFIGGMVAGEGIQYEIFLYGSKQLNPLLPRLRESYNKFTKFISNNQSD